jgi:hypothetical protein
MDQQMINLSSGELSARKGARIPGVATRLLAWIFTCALTFSAVGGEVTTLGSAGSRAEIATRPYLDALEAMHLKGRTGEEALALLSQQGYVCNADLSAFGGERSLNCWGDPVRMPTCDRFRVALTGDVTWEETENDKPSMVDRELDGRVKRIWTFCMPKGSFGPRHIGETWHDIDPTPQAQESVRATMRNVAKKAADLRSLLRRRLADGASCAVPDPHHVACTTREAGCSEVRSIFFASEPMDAAPRVEDATCTKGTEVRVGPKHYEARKWDTYEVLLLRVMCSRQDVRYPYPFGNLPNREQMPGAACLEKRHWMSDAFCGALADIDLEHDEAGASRVLDEFRAEMTRLKPVLDWDDQIMHHTIKPDACPEITLPAPAASSPGE